MSTEAPKSLSEYFDELNSRFALVRSAVDYLRELPPPQMTADDVPVLLAWRRQLGLGGPSTPEQRKEAADRLGRPATQAAETVRSHFAGLLGRVW